LILGTKGKIGIGIGVIGILATILVATFPVGKALAVLALSSIIVTAGLHIGSRYLMYHGHKRDLVRICAGLLKERYLPDYKRESHFNLTLLNEAKECLTSAGIRVNDIDLEE